MRKYNLADNLFININQALNHIFVSPMAYRESPADAIEEAELTEKEQQHIAGLMRVNHAGEVSAQGLYHGQALTANLDQTKAAMEQASQDESDHLAWCEQRLQELGSRKSILNPIWYFGSFSIGAIAGIAGDKWSLGFVAETERQVVIHLQSHLEDLPLHDEKTKAILEQMQIDENKHRTEALHGGGVTLPQPVQVVMTITSKVMVYTAYYI